jgi:hypothetical protein
MILNLAKMNRLLVYKERPEGCLKYAGKRERSTNQVLMHDGPERWVEGLGYMELAETRGYRSLKRGDAG